MRITDPQFMSKFILDNESPDYVIATEKCYIDKHCCDKLRHYLSHNTDSIFIFFTYECTDPDMNIFDYAFTWNPDLTCGDRIAHNAPYIVNNVPYVIQDDPASLENALTPSQAREILSSSPKFCNFVYSHPAQPRDSFFHLLSQYKRVDSPGKHLNNTGTQSTRNASDWYSLSIELKRGYKFSIAMENASYKGYTSEKLISSLQAHTVPIYWGNPSVADVINPKAFVNCHEYSSLEAVIDRVREIDNDDELWLDMVTQPWQTEQQRVRNLRDMAKYHDFMRHIFTQDLRTARRRPAGIWGDLHRKYFAGLTGVIHPSLRTRIIRKAGKLIPQRIKSTLKNLLHMA